MTLPQSWTIVLWVQTNYRCQCLIDISPKSIVTFEVILKCAEFQSISELSIQMRIPQGLTLFIIKFNEYNIERNHWVPGVLIILLIYDLTNLVDPNHFLKKLVFRRQNHHIIWYYNPLHSFQTMLLYIGNIYKWISKVVVDKYLEKIVDDWVQFNSKKWEIHHIASHKGIHHP